MNEQEKEGLGKQLIDAVKKPYSNGEEVQRLLDLGAPVNYQDERTGAAALHFAAGYNDISAVNAIMSHPDVDYLIRDGQGRLVSELASIAGNTELAEILIGKIKEQADERSIIAHMRHDEPIDNNYDNNDGPTFS